ncbi:MAG UNVERIFIED_CONTAM: hypothetical protein LVT10_21335 [Anaerolineae bacterium]|jgi:hypothetical protein
MTSSLSVYRSDHGNALLIWAVRSGLLGISGIGLWVMVLMMVFFGYQIAISNRMVPGVMIDGVDVGGLTLEQARAQLASSSRLSPTSDLHLRLSRARLASFGNRAWGAP